MVGLNLSNQPLIPNTQKTSRPQRTYWVQRYRNHLLRLSDWRRYQRSRYLTLPAHAVGSS
nr:MAG TPA: hypothetical protein [Caudoviricetes sp.]